MQVTVSRRTVSRRLNSLGYKSCKACKKPFVSLKNRRARVRWAQAHVQWTVAQWRNVLWSDESPFTLRWNGNVRVWRKVGERYHPDCIAGTVKQDKRIMVWGCFSAAGVGSFIRVKGILVKEKYKQILIHHAVPSGTRLLGRGFVFQQDNDPKHTAKIVTRYLARKTADHSLSVLPWPSQSPDANPIEHLWHILNENCSTRKPQNEEQLLANLQAGWRSIGLPMLRSLVDSMPRRCQAIIDSKGYPTKY